MSKSESETRGGSLRPSTARVVFVSVLGVSVSLLLVAAGVATIREIHPVSSGTVHGMAIVGFVLAEAIALYVGYGALAAAVEPSIHELLGGDAAWNSSD